MNLLFLKFVQALSERYNDVSVSQYDGSVYSLDLLITLTESSNKKKISLWFYQGGGDVYLNSPHSRLFCGLIHSRAGIDHCIKSIELIVKSGQA